jgi:hypothetical protein
MQASQTPTLVPLAFAANGTKNAIPEASQIGVTPGAASLNDGFPPLTFTPVAAGGVPPAGADFNGVLNLITQSIRWAHGGGRYAFSSTFAADANVSGYPAGAELMSADLQGAWLSLNDANTDNPDTGPGTKWVPSRAYGVTSVTGLTNANVTLTPAQAAKNRITLAGTLTGNVQIVFPTWLREWTIINNTTGAFTVTAKTAAGTGVAIPQDGSPTKVTGDGTNITQLAENIAAATQSQHAVQYGQMLAGGYTIATSVTYTNGLASNGAVVLANNTAYQAKNTGGTAFPISYIDASNNVTYGNSSLALAILGASATITPMLTMTNGAVLPNNVGYLAKTTGGAAIPLAFIDASNNVNLGNNALPTIIGGSAIQAVQPVSVGVATSAAHAVRYDQSFGIGQNLTNVLASRAIGTTYTNSTGKLITVNVAASAGGSGSAIGIFVSGMGEAAASIATAAAQALAINTTVPAGGTYVVQQSGPASTLASWYELR